MGTAQVAEIPGQSPTLLCPYVFHRKGNQIRVFRDLWATACKEANITDRVFHDFRRLPFEIWFAPVAVNE
jgi:integrase